MEIDLNSFLMASFGILLTTLISVISFFLKKQIKSLEKNIDGIGSSLIKYRENQIQECALHRQRMYNDFYKKDILDERVKNVDGFMQDIKEDISKIENRMNKLLNGK